MKWTWVGRTGLSRIWLSRIWLSRSWTHRCGTNHCAVALDEHRRLVRRRCVSRSGEPVACPNLPWDRLANPIPIHHALSSLRFSPK